MSKQTLQSERKSIIIVSPATTVKPDFSLINTNDAKDSNSHMLLKATHIKPLPTISTSFRNNRNSQQPATSNFGYI